MGGMSTYTFRSHHLHMYEHLFINPNRVYLFSGSEDGWSSRATALRGSHNPDPYLSSDMESRLRENSNVNSSKLFSNRVWCNEPKCVRVLTDLQFLTEQHTNKIINYFLWRGRNQAQTWGGILDFCSPGEDELNAEWTRPWLRSCWLHAGWISSCRAHVAGRRLNRWRCSLTEVCALNWRRLDERACGWRSSVCLTFLIWFLSFLICSRRCEASECNTSSSPPLQTTLTVMGFSVCML